MNLLVAGVHADHEHHAIAFPWLRTALAEAKRAAPLTLLPVVVAGFVRVVTNRHVFRHPMPPHGAIGAVEELLGSPHVRLGVHGGEWAAFSQLCVEHTAVGNDVTDAWIAASVLELNEHLVTFDRGFRRLLPPRHLTVLTA